MASDPDAGIRHSKAAEPIVARSEDEIAKIEAANALLQTECVRQLVMTCMDRKTFKLRPSAVLTLNREAIQGLSAYAGNWRPGDVVIGKSMHQPPGAHLVPELVEELCDYVNDNWATRSALHLASFVMWRLNWIHPFTDGNGRTSRATSYLVLCAKEGTWFPGVPTIPDQITAVRDPYYNALEAADVAYIAYGKTFDHDVVADMESLLGTMLAIQLRAAHESAKA